MPDLDLITLEALMTAYYQPGDERFIGAARCNVCCPVAVLMRRQVGQPAHTFVEFTRCAGIVYPHSAELQLLVRLIDVHPKGKPIGRSLILKLIVDIRSLPEET